MNMNKLITTLSIAVILGVKSVSFASGEAIDAFSLDGNYGNGQILVEQNFTAPGSGGEDGCIKSEFGGFGITEEKMPKEKDKQQN